MLFWTGVIAGAAGMGALAFFGAMALLLRFGDRLSRERLKSRATGCLLTDYRHG